MSVDVGELETLGQNALLYRLAEATTELEKLTGFADRTAKQEERSAELMDLTEAIDARLKVLDRESRLERVRAAANAGHVEHGDDRGFVDRRPVGPRDQARDTAMRHLDRFVKAGDLDARSAERVEGMFTDVTAGPPGLAARWAAAGSDPEYVTGFFKAISGERGHLLWTPAEQEAYRRMEQVRAEMRAMGAGTGSAGGFQIPVIIDPAVRISSDGSVSPIRMLAENRVAIGAKWRPVTSAHVVNQWTDEHAEWTDGTPTLASPEIDAYKSTAFVPFSFEYESAYGGAIGDLTRLLVDGREQLLAEAFLNGNGTSQPEGLWTGLDDTGSELAPTVAETFDEDDVYKTQNALAPRFQPAATWQANLATINELSTYETDNGAPRFPRVGDIEPVLLRKRLYENSRMRGVDDIDAVAETVDNPVLIYGDIRQAYTIVDFAGSTVELVPHLFSSTNPQLPTGDRGLMLWSRVGAGVVIPGAAVVMNVATTSN